MNSEQIIMLRSRLRKEKMNTNTIDFFINLVTMFEWTDELVTTSRKLAKISGRSERSIQRYMKSLKDADLIFIKPIWNNHDPEKPFICKTVYRLTNKSIRMLEAANITHVKQQSMFGY